MYKQRFYIDTELKDDKACIEAIEFACKLSENDNEIKRIVLLLHSKKVNDTNTFEILFGRKIVRKLLSEGTIIEGYKPIFKFETANTIKKGFHPTSIVVSFYLDADKLFKIDENYSVKAIVAIPWQKRFTQEWVEKWQPIEIRSQLLLSD